MSFKQALAKIQDSKLIQIFLQFAQNFNLQYEKISKQISYKCFEANWIMASTKATGYGRNQVQAYKNALRNLIELLVLEQQYENYFKHTFQDLRILSKKMTIKESIKTQTNQEKLHKTNYLRQSQISSNNNKINAYQNYYNINYSKGYSKKSDDQKELHKNQSFKPQNHLINNNNQSNGTPQRQKQQIHYSKIHLNKSLHSTNKQNKNIIYTESSSEYTDELSRAKQKLKTLQDYLFKINKQNWVLKQRINTQANQCLSTLPSNLDSDQSEKLNLNNMNLITKTDNTRSIKKIIGQQNHQKFYQIYNFNKGNELNVPKLKLQLLPNYHKKSQKSLNQSLLAVYQQKYCIKKIY